MWIETTNTDSTGAPVTRSLGVPGTDDEVTFSDNCKAQVTRDVGEELIARYASVVPVEDDSSSDDSEETDDETQDTDEE